MAANSQFLSFKPNAFTGDAELKNLTLPGALTRGVDGAQVGIALAYAAVPWFRRAVKLRAAALGRFPIGLTNDAGEDVSELPEWQGVMLWTRALLYRTEMNLVKYGAAYHLIEKNVYGQNWTPRFLPTNSVTPVANLRDGLTGFRVGWMGDTSGEYPLNKFVYVWEPNDESEIEPGPSDGQAALKAAGLLYAIDEMANRYMSSGGVPITAVSVPPTMDKDEAVKIEGWLAKKASGFRNAFKFLVVKKDTTFTQIGSEMSEIQATELTASQRDNVAVAIGVPPTVLDGKSANYATAQSEMTGFYMNTVIPEAEMLEPLLNTQLYQRLGLTLRFCPDELEVMQAIQLDQAAAVVDLVGKPPLSLNEGRAILEYEELPGDLGDWKEPPPPPQFGAPAASPAETVAASAASLGDASPDPVEQMKAWKDAALAQIKGGSPATVGAWFDDELAGASSGKMVRGIFEQHWPKSAKSLQERAVAALEQYNALVLAGSVA